MILTQQSKEYYIQVIHDLWPDFSYYTANNVNEAVADDIDTIIREVAEKSRYIGFIVATLQAAVQLLLSKDARSFAENTFSAWGRLKNALESDRIYKSVIDTARWRWKSAVAIDLMGL